MSFDRFRRFSSARYTVINGIFVAGNVVGNDYGRITAIGCQHEAHIVVCLNSYGSTSSPRTRNLRKYMK